MMYFFINGVELERSVKKKKVFMHFDGQLWRRETVGTVNQRRVSSGDDSSSFSFTHFLS